MPDEEKPRKPIFTSYVFKNPGTEVGGGGGNLAMLGGNPENAEYVVLTYQYEDPIVDLNEDPTPNG